MAKGIWKGADEKPTAVVFIHGIGIQDRYQQLEDFVRGVSTRGVEYAGKIDDVSSKGPMGTFHVLEAQTKEGEKHQLHFYEVFWGPLLNGLTSPLSVVRWGLMTIWQTLPWNKKANVGKPPPDRMHTTFGKWTWQGFYFLLLVALAVTILLGFLSATLLSSDRLVYLHDVSKTRKRAAWKERRYGLAEGVPYVKFREPSPAGTAAESFTVELPKNKERPRVMNYSTGRDKWTGEAETRPDANAPTAIGTAQFISLVPTYLFDRLDTKGLTFPYDKLVDALQAIDYLRLLKAAVFAVIWFWLARWVFRTLTQLFKLVLAIKAGTKPPGVFQILAPNAAGLVLNLVLLGLYFVLKLEMDLVLVQFFISTALFVVIYKGLKFGLSDVAGDVEIYSTRNENSKKYKGREEVLFRTVVSIKKILESDRYGSVVVVGHSLGSVIGLDALRRLFTDYTFDYGSETDRTWYEKLHSFVTLGSPLEKTRLFFEKEDYRSNHQEFSRKVDARMFCGGTDSEGAYPIPWFNFWYWSDIVSDPLSSYPLRPQHEKFVGTGRLTWSHSDYWEDPKFVDPFWDVVLAAKPDGLEVVGSVNLM